jgi:hypothetical protein
VTGFDVSRRRISVSMNFGNFVSPVVEAGRLLSKSDRAVLSVVKIRTTVKVIGATYPAPQKAFSTSRLELYSIRRLMPKRPSPAYYASGGVRRSAERAPKGMAGTLRTPLKSWHANEPAGVTAGAGRLDA